jgi:hypothetical protein
MEEKNELVLDVQLGGYYAKEDENGYGFFRLLDFNKEEFQVQTFRETFDHMPTYDEVKGLSPFIWHAPIAITGLFAYKQVQLIGHEELTTDTLSGFREYLQSIGIEEEQASDIAERLVAYSMENPVKFKISRSGDEVTVSVAE